MNKLVNLYDPDEYENTRLKELYNYDILDSDIEKELDDLTQLAAALCNAPMALISLIDKDRQWFKSRFGIDFSQTHRSISFCHYTIQDNVTLEVFDTLHDERFCQNPLVLEEPKLRYYCGAPLINSEGYKLGSLCVLDRSPKNLTQDQKQALEILAKQVVTHFELKKKTKQLEDHQSLLEKSISEKTSDLAEANKELNTFIYKASHSLRGPLATISGISELAQVAVQEKEALALFESCKQTCNKLDRTLQDLLEFVEIRDKALYIEPVEVSKIGKIVLEKYQQIKINLTNNLDGNMIYTDKELFMIIVFHIIENSINFQCDYKPLTINFSIEKADNFLKIILEDNGEGMREDVINQVFRMFYKGNVKSKGAGLGLYIVKKAVAQLNGTISVNSTLGSGTSFTIFLPLFY